MATTARDSEIPAGSIRQDAWWVQPLLTVLVLGGFIVYATWRTFENAHFTTLGTDLFSSGRVGDLLSPFYSPHIAIDWKILGYHVSPALLILPFPLSFRLTCYYYRKAYYRSFFGKPAACGVPGSRNLFGQYTGEKYWPMAFQNLHRFAFYAAFIFIFILAFDVYKSTHFIDGWGISVGTIVLLLNVVFLAAYTFGCHSWRHLIGGKIDCFSCSVMNKTRYGLWKKATVLNENHQLWAWTSLFGVALTDLYIRLVTSGAIADHIFFKVANG
ncbi:MAG: succinate dehydrogenase [Fimbriimonadales bacterium]